MTALFDQLKSFMVELSEMYPEDSDFPLFITSLQLIKTTNPSMLIKYMYDNLTPFEEKIMSRDEKFFLDNSFSEYDGYIDMNLFGKLKGYVKDMSTISKESVWKYTQNVFRLVKATYLQA
jgi:hypothetical protein